MNRRDFCKKITIVGGTIVLAPTLKACAPVDSQIKHSRTADLGPTRETILATRPSVTQSPAPIHAPTQTIPTTPTQTTQPEVISTPVTESIRKTKVTLVKTTDRYQGVIQALALLNSAPVSGQKVFIKPNFNSADDAPASTDTKILHALIEYLYGNGAKNITIGDRSGMANTRSVMEHKGIFELASELGIDTLVFDELDDKDWVLHHSTDYYWSRGFALPKPVIETDCIVQTCNLKTHRYGGHFTMSLKNSVGFVAKEIGTGHNFMNELHNSPDQRKMIADINSAYKPQFIVMDGIDAFSEGGPAKGKVIHPGVVLASEDRIAIDAIGVAILRQFGTTPEVSQGTIFEQEQIARAVELGLGVNHAENIEIVTADEESYQFAQLITRFF